MTSIALTMVVTGLINLEQGIFLTMGSNIGSCVVAILAGLASGKNAKRTALIHLLFNCSGVVIFLFVGWILNLVSGGSFNFGVMFERKRIYTHGEKEVLAEKERMEHGIPVNDNTMV